ncbi:14996_t:CDS:2 [Funneliformis geosporum]|uniref:16336_t:CDS:1 n=1 Tax=Funneliformis geosporum TaxID=1117311 RepID=A0A9W4WZI3_9GLOM|nr:16336_t:CDS:2 [Funneliformis geosporum]CAI2194209.1 14996_t:CDS:2 [Funneliformis geosporum]
MTSAKTNVGLRTTRMFIESETNNDEKEENNKIDMTDVGNKEQNYTLLSLTDESSFISTVIDIRSAQKFQSANNVAPSFSN